MNYNILYQNSFPLIQCHLRHGEMIKAESGAMVGMSSTLDLEGKMEGGVMGGISRALAGEHIFFQYIKASRGPGEVLLAPTAIGGIVDVELDGSYEMIVQKDGFLAADMNVKVSTHVQNLAQGLLSGEGFFVLKVSGRGTVFLSSLGAIHVINLEPGQEYIVDNGHLVAWTNYTDYKIEKASSDGILGGWVSSFTSGEGLVCRFKGEGKVLIQTRNPRSLGDWVGKLIPANGKSAPPPQRRNNNQNTNPINNAIGAANTIGNTIGRFL